MGLPLPRPLRKMFHVVLILFVLVYDVFILALCADFSVIKKADYFVRNFCYFSFDEGHR